jgi:hypothetical protein
MIAIYSYLYQRVAINPNDCHYEDDALASFACCYLLETELKQAASVKGLYLLQI